MVREWSIERDDRLMKELYPDVAKKVLPFIEAECDRMEYNGSRMYDEFPDRQMMRRTNDRIYETVQREVLDSENAFPGEKKPEEIYADDDIFATSFRPRREPEEKGGYLQDLIDVLMYHEMFSRRCRHNQCKCCRR